MVCVWLVAVVRDLGSMFVFASTFKGDLSRWSFAMGTDVASMFMSASSPNGDLNN